jgi:hypothetical protein
LAAHDCFRKRIGYLAVVLGGWLLFVSWPAVAEPENLAGKWLAVAGKDLTLEGIWRKKANLGEQAEITSSSLFAGLDPGWYLLVSGAYRYKGQARTACKKLLASKIDCVVEQAGELFDFSDGKARLSPLSAESAEAGRGICRGRAGLQAPDGKTSVSFAFLDPTSDGLVIHSGGQRKQLEGLFFKTRQVYWSPDSSRIAFGDEDLFSKSGNQRMLIVDLPSLEVSKVETTKLGKDKKHGKRDAYWVSDICWMPDSDQLRFKLSVDYVGKSGNSDIDGERRSRLGDKFGSHDPIVLGEFAVCLLPRQQEFSRPPAGLQLYDPAKFGYIDRTGKTIIKPRFDRAGPFVGGSAVVQVGGQQMTIDKQGKPVASGAEKKEPAGAEAGKPAPVPVKIGERFGYSDESGMIVIDPLYDEAFPFSDGLARVKLGAKFGYIDQKGRTVIQPDFSEAADFSEGLAAVKIGS